MNSMGVKGLFCHEILDTPGKINMEPENTPLEKENHLHKPSFSGSRGRIPNLQKVSSCF